MQINEYYRQKRRAAVLRKSALTLCVSVLCVFTAWGFFWVPYFRISEIEISNGAEESAGGVLDEYLAKKTSLFLPKNNFFLASAEEIRNVIKNKGFGIAQVEKKFPKTISVKFEKSEPWLIYCKAPEECYYVDALGALSERAPRFSRNPLTEITGKVSASILGDKLIPAKILVVIKFWFDSIGFLDIQTAKFDILENGDFKIFIEGGWFLYLNINLDHKKAFGDLKLLLDQKIKEDRARLEYIDMRFDNKAFYKLK